MRAERISSRWLEPLTDFMHAKRQGALLDVVGALLAHRDDDERRISRY